LQLEWKSAVQVQPAWPVIKKLQTHPTTSPLPSKLSFVTGGIVAWQGW